MSNLKPDMHTIMLPSPVALLGRIHIQYSLFFSLAFPQFNCFFLPHYSENNCFFHKNCINTPKSGISVPLLEFY